MTLASKWEAIIDRNKLLKGLANVICMEKCPREAKVSAISGISNMLAKKDTLAILLKLPKLKFLDSFSEILTERNVIFSKG